MTARTWAALDKAVFACGLAGVLILACALTGDAAVARRAPSDSEAVRLLRDAAEAARRVPYEGVQVVTTWNRRGGRPVTSRVDIAHTPGEGTYVGDRADDGGRAAYRSDAAAGHGPLTGFTAAMLELLTRNYAVVRADDSSVCGRAARVVEARRRDGSPAGRFWIDAETGLMLYRELLDGTGRTITATGFDQVTIPSGGRGGEDAPARGTALGKAAVAPARNVSPWEDRLDPAELGDLRDHGWPLPRALPGLSLSDARRSTTRPTDGTVHLTFSDGLESVSVFVQRGSLDETSLTDWNRTVTEGDTVFRRRALRQWAVWADDGYVFTVVTDGPEAAAERAVDALPHGGGDVRTRLGRGLRRLASWGNPFG
ncbi:sigma-E factor regulatory protein RseB domain-containing protein [Actinomadura keratinilytica]|uniref:MucB/RseB N-terminal domain-containing protein n=1 Tax=Actinomadura keratinilytica TaxID=547461 RepID=A0ABP7YBT9_9ACTN